MSVTFETARQDPDRFMLMVGWISGEGEGGDVSFDLTCGAGLGNSSMVLTVKIGDRRIIEEVDIRDGLTAWVTRLADELRAESVPQVRPTDRCAR